MKYSALGSSIIAATLAATLGLSGSAFAQAKKPISIIVGFGSGGAYYMTALLVSQHMPKYLPGKPKIIVKNMPGAGSIVATNYLANIAPKDGSVLGVIGAGTITEAMFGNTKVKYDPRKLGWIGSMSTGVNLCTVWSTTGVKTIADAQKKQIIAGSTGRGSRTTTYPLAMNKILGTKFKIVTGYKGFRMLQPALEKGEVQAICGYAWEGLKAQKLAWLTEGKLNIIAQFARSKSADFPKVPLMRDLVKTNTEKQALDLMVIDTLIAWPVVTPPGLPPKTLKMYRDAFAKTMKDPEFIAAAKKVKRTVDLVTGEQVDKIIAEAYAYPKDAIDTAKKFSGLK